MKKTYMNPETRVIKIQTQQMIAESQTSNPVVSFSETSLEGSAAVSRRGFNVWGDDEEFDEE